MITCPEYVKRNSIISLIITVIVVILVSFAIQIIHASIYNIGYSDGYIDGQVIEKNKKHISTEISVTLLTNDMVFNESECYISVFAPIYENSRVLLNRDNTMMTKVNNTNFIYDVRELINEHGVYVYTIDCYLDNKLVRGSNEFVYYDPFVYDCIKINTNLIAW